MMRVCFDRYCAAYVLVATVLLAPLAFDAQARMVRTAAPAEKGICFFWWPELPDIPGWKQDLGNSRHYNSNALAPVGENFRGAETVMLAKAVYKPEVPEHGTLEAFIESDKNEFARHPDLPVMTEVEPLVTADGQKLRTFTFEPRGQGNWERVSYGEEGDFYLTFTVSSRTPEGCRNALPDFEKMVRGYARGEE